MADRMDLTTSGVFSAKVKRILFILVVYIILYAILIIFLYPYYHLVVMATRNYETIFTTPPPFIPGKDLVNNLKILFSEIPFGINILNSIVISSLATLSQVVFCTMAAFALVKYEFRFKKIITTLVFASIMFPRFLWIIPTFQLMVWFKWVNTYFAMFIPQIGNALGLFILIQYMKTSIPNAIMDSAKIDGLSDFQMLIHIAFPLSKAGIGILATYIFVTNWNDFFYGLIMLTNEITYTVPVALSVLNGMHQQDVLGPMFLANIISVIPVLLAFLLFSRKIIPNMLAGSIKG